ncbi:MAG TPA: copper resistance protein CopC [Acidimicrobiales bacterium]|nr:copper resistance protein CopC [Acidimicrobiales bacterium]
MWVRGRHCCALVLLVAVVLASAAPADAHATLVETNPADDQVLRDPPDEVILRFDERVEVTPGAVEVLDRDGGRIDRGDVEDRDGGREIVVPIDDGGQGTYTVGWRVLSEDGHELAGSFVFHVGTRTGAVDVGDSENRAVDVADGVARWIALSGLFVLVGTVAIALMAARDRAVVDRLHRLALLGAVAGLLGTAAGIVTQAAAASGRSVFEALDLVTDVTLDTRTGRLAVLRVAGFAAVVLALVVARRLTRQVAVLVGALAVAVAVVTSIAGHAWTVDARMIAVVADTTHLLTAGVWIGGVVVLLVTLSEADDRSAMVRRFSQIALVTLAVVAATGSVHAFLQADSFDALFGTTYGLLVLLKVAGLVGLGALGWVNRYRLLPKLEEGIERLRQSLLAEIGVAAVVLGLTVALIGMAPARDVYSRSFDGTEQVGALTVQMVVDPARRGTNTVHLYFYEDDRTTPAVVDAVELQASTGDLPPRRLEVEPITPSHASAYGASLPAGGTWTVEVTAVQAGRPTVVPFEVPIK